MTRTGLFTSLLGAALILQQAWAAPAKHNSNPVCIIGAGPAGLVAASSLEKKGYETVIFEKQALIGGKCQSYYDNGLFTPLGAAFYSNASYPAMLPIINAAGVPSSPIKLGAGSDRQRYAYDYRTGSVAAVPSPSAAQIQAVSAEVPRYVALWQEAFAPWSLPNFKNGVPDELTVPAAEWFLSNNFTALPALLTDPIALYGYGDIRVVPALYILQYMTPDMVLTFLGQHDAYLIDFQKVWLQFAKTNIKGKINTNTAINRIERSKSCTTIRHNAGKQSCSSIILAFPPTLENLFNAGLSPSRAERRLFSTVGVHNYFTTIASLKMPYGISYTAAPANTSATAPLINPPPSDGEPVAMLRLHEASNITVAWSWGKYQSFVATGFARGLAQASLSKINKDPRVPEELPTPVTDSDIKVFRKWDYFPHFDTQQLADGAYDRLNALQGQSRTYFASGLAGFENVEWAVQGGLDVVDSYF